MAVDFIGDGLALRSKGDIVSSDGTADLALPVGANNQILSAQSSATSGLVWIDPTTQPTLSMEVISSSVATASVTSFTFSNIPSGYRDLRIIGVSKNTTTTSGAANNFTIKVNGSTASIYSESRYDLDSGGSLSPNVTQTSAGYTAQMNLPGGIYPNSNGSVPYSNGIFWMDIHGVSNTDNYKPVTVWASGMSQSLSVSPPAMAIGGWQILTTSVISSVEITGAFTGASAFHLWGIK